ncbi:hypothetical protein SAMN05444396_101101 [Flavobacterium segetis]|uniref:Uncharacterized protein n=1 Tax=Flavobacterium segetis TaxID=271157 RepID=A0A1M5E177_9FLAO|nr:hypothetical protein [Flavobacterium segetis]SHF72989.1 hypothetical protein SAMN05444396_101101 [Flavobacterium segetis]
MKTFKLENEPKIESGFITPDHYFKNFSLKMMDQIVTNETKVISIFQKRKYLFFSAAALLLFALMIPIVNNWSAKSTELDAVALENYITYQTNVNQYDLINALEEDDINSMNVSLAIEDKTIEEILSYNPNVENLITE